MTLQEFYKQKLDFELFILRYDRKQRKLDSKLNFMVPSSEMITLADIWGNNPL